MSQEPGAIVRRVPALGRRNYRIFFVAQSISLVGTWMQQVAQAFPRRAIILFSGYRDGHSGLHQQGRALDLAVHGVPNSELFAVCKSLRDVGCGYYPENKFIHVDVRPYATGHVLWVDASRPGTPSRYVDGWPGVAEPGEVWLGY